MNAMKKTEEPVDFRAEGVGRVFRRMFLPSLVSLVSMVALNITDGAFVGRGVGSEALAAVNIVAPLFMFMTGIGLMLGMGGSVAASLRLSRGHRHVASLLLTQGAVVGGVLGVLLCSVILLFPEQTCLLFGCSERLLPQAVSYLRWIALMMPATVFGMVGMFAVRLDGSPRFAMLVNLGVALLNILLDWLFIFPLDWGLAGAGMATCLSFTLGCLPVLYYFFRRSHTLRPTSLRLSLLSPLPLLRLARSLGMQMRLGFPALLGEGALAGLLIVGNYVFMAHLGEQGVAAFSVACYCLPLIFMLGNAIIQSVQPVLSFAHGAGNAPRLLQARNLSILTAVFCGVLSMLGLSLGAEQVAAVFLKPGDEAWSLCVAGLPWFSASFLFIAINIVWVGYLQSRERAMAAACYTLLRGGVLLVPVFVMLPRWLGEPGLWLALPLAEGLTTLSILLAPWALRK